MATKTQSDARAVLVKELTSAKDLSSLSFDNQLIQPLSKYVDAIIERRMSSAYGEFISLTDPIITSLDVDGMVEEAKRLVPIQWRMLQAILGYDTAFKKRSETEEVIVVREHLLQLYNRITLYEIMALSRVRNPHNFVYWACIAAAVMYGQSNLDVSRRIPTFFGFSTSRTTLASRTAAMSKLTPYYIKVKQALSTQLIRWRDNNNEDHEQF
jgi:hypothetical protein